MSTASKALRRYAVIGTGHRAQTYIDALASSHADVGHIVAFVDPNEVRMRYYDDVLTRAGYDSPAHYEPAGFERMLDEQRPDAVIVTSVDSTHARYIVTCLERGVDVITEKPMTIDVPSLRAIVAAAEDSAARLVVGFNYRYSPRNAVVREIIASGQIGTVTSVHFEWCLDTVHGADYFRRWHRQKENSGGLAVHKSTHHFDLVNWWIDAVPATVFALGGLRFYGEANARGRGLTARPRLGRDLVESGDPFALEMAGEPRMKALYLDAEGIDGYERDRDVFGEGIDAEDNLSVLVGYAGGASLSYSLTAHSPWEGYRVAINGTEGRVELDVVERGAVVAGGSASVVGPKRPVVDPSAQAAADAAGPLRPRGERVILQRLWQAPVEVPIPAGAGAHGGGDAAMLDDLFRGTDSDPLGRSADYRDGVRSVVIGASVNVSLESGEPVSLADWGLGLSG